MKKTMLKPWLLDILWLGVNPRKITTEVIKFHGVSVLIVGIKDIQNRDAINSLGIQKDGIK